MNRSLITLAGGVLIATLLGFSVWGRMGITQHLIVGIDRISETTDANMNKVGDAADSLKGTTAAATGTLQSAAVTIQTTNRTLAAAQPVLGHLGATVVGLSRECVPGQCGILPDIAKLLNTIRGTAGQIEIAAMHEKVKMTSWAGVWLGVQKVHSVLPPLF